MKWATLNTMIQIYINKQVLHKFFDGCCSVSGTSKVWYICHLRFPCAVFEFVEIVVNSTTAGVLC